MYLQYNPDKSAPVNPEVRLTRTDFQLKNEKSDKHFNNKNVIFLSGIVSVNRLCDSWHTAAEWRSLSRILGNNNRRVFPQILSEVDENDITLWLGADNNGGYEPLTDEEVIASFLPDANESDAEEADGDIEDPVMSHGDAVTKLNELMVYFERQAETSPAELLYIPTLIKTATGRLIDDLTFWS
ncbi:hypothetical protein J6590_083569 [Homalodisca vitripennis]|nr:hypothetical protein J6590_083569 [Homalodisca vitripennis]